MFRTAKSAYLGIALTIGLASGASALVPRLSWGVPFWKLFPVFLGFWTIGFLYRVYAVRYLAGSFSLSIKPPPSLVTTGPYQLIRHPCYFGTLIQAFGAGVLTGNWIGLLTMLAGIWFVLLDRIKTEEELLSNSFGLGYIIYRLRVPRRLIPFVY